MRQRGTVETCRTSTDSHGPVEDVLCGRVAASSYHRNPRECLRAKLQRKHIDLELPIASVKRGMRSETCPCRHRRSCRCDRSVRLESSKLRQEFEERVSTHLNQYLNLVVSIIQSASIRASRWYFLSIRIWPARRKEESA